MSSPSTEERIERLERELADAKRRSHRLHLLVLGLAAAGLALAWAGDGGRTAPPARDADVPGDTLRATAFMLQDADGVIHGGLGVTETGATLGLLDADGRTRAVLGVTEAGPTLGLLDADGTIRAELKVTENEPSVRLFDPEGGLIWSAPR